MLHFISKKWRKFDGQIFLMYIVWYGAGRFFIEGLRTDSLYLGTIKISQAVALLSVVVGLVLLIVGFSRTKRMGSDYHLYVDTEESKALLAESDKREQEWQEKHMHKKAADAPAPSILAEDAKEPAEDAKEPAAPAETAPETTNSDAEEPAGEKTEEEKKAEKDAKIDALLEEMAKKDKD